MRRWRNGQTRQLEGLVGDNPVEVRLLFAARNYHKIRKVGAVQFQIPHQGQDVRFPSTGQGGERNPEGNSGN